MDIGERIARQDCHPAIGIIEDNLLMAEALRERAVAGTLRGLKVND